MLKLVGLLFNPWFIGGVIIVAVISFVGLKGYSLGVERTDIKWQTVIAKNKADWEERQRLAAEEANNEINKLLNEKEAADDLIVELRTKALADPNAGRVGLGVDSVKRLNREIP